MNKYKLYMILGIILLVLSITGSLAYYVWSSSTTSIAGNLCLPEIYFTGGATINGKLKPVSSKEEGLIKEIEVNMAYRWFLRIGITEEVPHFSTFGKNYTRRFKDTDLFEQIFSKILEKSTDGNESRAYLCMHESEKTGKDSGKTRLEYSHFFIF